MVETVEGNTADESRESATDGVDYTGVPPKEVVFEDGDSATKTFTISLTDDTEPEIAEQFTVVLSNPPGGSALIDPDADEMVVTIAASDSPGGVFSLSPTSLTLSEESAPSGTITVQRTGGALTQVTIQWEALYTDGQIHDTAINSILGADRASLTFPVGVTSVDINLTLQPNSVPASGEVFTLRIQSDDTGIMFGSDTEATVTVLAKQSSLFQISAPDIKKVVTQSGAVAVGVERVNGTQLTATVQYATVELSGNTTIGQLTLQPAQFGVHYTGTAGSLTFPTSTTSGDIPLNVIDPEVTYPRAFTVVISTSQPHDVRSSEATLVLTSPGPLSRLIDIYFDTLESTNTAQLESVTNSLYKLLSEGALVGSTVQFVNGENQLQFDVTQYILREVTSRASGRYTGSLMGNISDIFQLVLGDATFTRRSEFVETMQSFAYSLLDGEPCSINAPVTKTLSRLLFHLVAERLSPSSLAQRRFTASFNTDDDDFVKFPRTSIFPGSSLAGVECVDVHYIELVEERILQESTLDGKVLSIGIRGQSSQTQSPVTYRIYTDTKVMPLENDCLLWNRTLKTWDDKTCKTITSGLLPTRNSYVECECHRLGEFAVVADVERGFGWSLSGGLVAAFVAVVVVMVIGVHVCYFQRTQLITRIFVMLCVSILLYQVMLLVAVFASDRPDTTESGCTAIAIMLHFTVILQFVWILALAVSLWTNFMGMTDGKEPLVIYAIVCWVVAILWVVSTILIGRFGLDGLQFSDVYGLAGDFCYTPELSVSLVSTLLPVVLAMLATVAFLSHSCIYWSRWEDFHNMYLDSFNKTEIPLLLMLFVTVFLSGVGAYVHLYVREVYTFGIFVTLEFFQGLYTLIVYVFLSWHTLTRKHRKYGIDDEVEPLTVPGEPDYLGSMSTLASSTRQLNIKQEEEKWQEKHLESNEGTDSDEDSSASSIEGAPVIPLGLRQFPSEDPSLEGDDSQLDDLMFMLKTHNVPEGEEDDTLPLFPESPHKPTTSEHLELRRISIADTHL